MNQPPKNNPKPWIGQSEYPKRDDCEQWPSCPQCGGTRIIRNGWLFCRECLFAELIQK